MICATGGKGLHIHTLFNKITFKTEQGKNLFKTALEYQLDYKHIRLWFWNMILEEAGIEEKYREKNVDPKILKFNYHSGTTHLIRDIGGRKYGKDVDGEFKPLYKTYIPIESFKNANKPRITRFEDVVYPDIIPTFDIDENEFISYLMRFVENQQKNEVSRLTVEKINGLYTELDGVLKVREGMNEGNRSSGAAVIAIAAKIDNLSKEEAYKIIEEYVRNCSQSGTLFTKEEGNQWVDWIYNHESPYWNCQLLEDLNVHDRNTCQHCQARNKETLKILTKTKLLDDIKDVLDMEIVGEDDIKILIFLLLLSKDFPSKTGKPGWNIPGDPMSQNVILSCDSSSGKSWIAKVVLQLFGDEDKDYFIVSRVTKNAMNYYTDINMDGKILFIEELQGLDEHTSQLRVWMSEGKLSLQTVEKTINNEGIEINSLVQKSTVGQPVFMTNQAEGAIEDQLNNRSWVLSLDVTETQTGNILDYQDKLTKGNYKLDLAKKRNIKEALKQLKPYHFIIPFADRTVMGIPLNDVRSRRDYNKFLTLIKCSAYLHQYQREKYIDEEKNEFIICDIKDYEIARRYSSNVLGATFSGLTNVQIDLINYIKNSSWKDEFMVSDIMRNLGKSQPHWSGIMKQLEDLGYVTADKANGKSTIYHIVESKAFNLINLPSGQELLQRLKIAPISAISEIFENDDEIAGKNAVKTEVLKKPLIALIGANNLASASSDPSEPTNQYSEMLPKKTQFYTIGEKVVGNGRSNICEKDGNLFTGANQVKTTRTQVVEYMKKTNNHVVTFEEIASRFKCKDSELQPVLQELLKEGTIFETRPARYILL